MSENPLSGLSVPSVKALAAEIVSRIRPGVLDLSNPLQRQRLANYLEYALGMALNLEVRSTLSKATERAIAHVFRLMDDPDYQEKRRRRLAESRKVKAERREKERAAQELVERNARMDYSKGRLQKAEVPKPTVN